MRLLPGKASGGSAGVYSARNSQVSTLPIYSPLTPVSNVILPFSPNSYLLLKCSFLSFVTFQIAFLTF